jgi:hypothetical protein
LAEEYLKKIDINKDINEQPILSDYEIRKNTKTDFEFIMKF